MKHSLLVVTLFSFSAFAAEPIPEVVSTGEAPSTPVKLSTPHPERFAISVTAASLVSVSTSVLGGVLALSVPSYCTAQFGAPRPMCGVAGVAIAGATQLLISLLLIPELFRISGDDPAAVRAGWWRWARWPAAVLAASALMVLAGSASEAKNYGTGQGTIITGLAGAAVSGVSVDVMGLIGAVKAAKKGHR